MTDQKVLFEDIPCKMKTFVRLCLQNITFDQACNIIGMMQIYLNVKPNFNTNKYIYF